MASDGGRRGGREARRQLRAAPLEEALRPVRAGLEGGRYRPLRQTDITTIHGAALDVLERLGMAQALPSCIEACTARGAFVNELGRLCFPRALVEDVVAGAARRFPLYGQDPRHDLEPWGTKVHFGTAGAAVHMVDLKTATTANPCCRTSTMPRASSTRSTTSTFSSAAMVPRDMPVPWSWISTRSMPALPAPPSMSAPVSPCGHARRPASRSSTPSPAARLRGGRARSSPFLLLRGPALDALPRTPAVPRGRRGRRHAGAAPLGGPGRRHLAGGTRRGSVVQAVAEVLAALFYVNALKPGAPAIFGTWPFVSDLRTGAMSGGRPSRPC